ncbi:MAG: hypothetical protein ACM3ZT_00180 [Bacillota bacterium]
MIGIAALARLTQALASTLAEDAQGWRRAREPAEPGEIGAPPDEFITIATYDKVLDAHIALGRLFAEGIEAELFDDHMVQMDWLYALAVGGIKLRVSRENEHAARKILETDYSKTLEGADLGRPED